MPPKWRPPEPTESPTLPLPPPRSTGDLDEIVVAVGATPIGETQLIQEYIASIAKDAGVLDLIHDALRERPVRELGHTMTLLAITGEFRNERSLDVLGELIWSSNEDLWGVLAIDAEGCIFDVAGMIQGRAAEMFAWIAAARRDDDLLSIVRDHPDVVTRLAAADAFLFHHEDSEESKERLMATVREDDRPNVGVPRLVRGDIEEFDARIAEMSSPAELPGSNGNGGKAYGV